MKKNLKFLIVIPTRQINDCIRKAIPYHLKQSYKNFEIIIVSEANEKEKFPKTRIIKVGKVPPSEKRNIGVRESYGDIICFIDDDAYPERDWLEKAVKEFENKDVVAVGGPGLVPKSSSFFQRVSSEVYRLSSVKTGMRYGKVKRQEVEDWLTCNFFVRKRDFLRSGGFDSRYWGGEDTQVCFKIRKKGKVIIYNPEVVVYHHPRKDLRSHLRQTLFWAMWRGFLTKKYPKDSLRLTFLAPSLLVLWLFFGGIISSSYSGFGYFYAVVFVLYLAFLLTVGARAENLSFFFPVIFVTFLSQLIYGVGFIRGIFFGEPTQATFNPAESIIIK